MKTTCRCGANLKRTLERVCTCTMEIRTPILGLSPDDNPDDGFISLNLDWENESEEEVSDGMEITNYECYGCGTGYNEREVREIFK